MAKYRLRRVEVVDARWDEQAQRWWLSVNGPEDVWGYTKEEFERFYEKVEEPKIELPPCVCRNEYCYECNPGNFK